jgi:acetylornithine deacetylase
MKGGLSRAIFAAKAILDTGVKIKGSLIIESVIGEEDGGVGSLATILRGYSADGAIVMEPSEAKVAPAHAGALSFRVSMSGKAAHACVREEGVSAIDKFILIYNSLRDLEIERNSNIKHPLFERCETPYALNVGTVHGGEWPGSVAESLVFEGRIGVAVGEKVEEARRTLEKAVTEAASSDPWLRDHPPIVQWHGYQFDSASISTDEPILQTVVKAFSDATGTEAKLEGMTYASDMRHLINTGNTPTLIFGPGDVRRAHSTNEYVLVKELTAVVRTLVLTILRFCGYKKE